MIAVIILLIMAVSGTVNYTKAQTKNDQILPFSFDDHVLTEVIEDVFDDLPDEEFALDDESNFGSTKGGNAATGQTYTKFRTGTVMTSVRFRRLHSSKRHSR